MTRRLLFSFAAAPLFAATPKAKLTSLEIFQLPVNKRGDWILIRVHTDQGVSGIGDASHGRDATTIAEMQKLFEQMKGRSFSDIEYLRKLGLPVAKQHGMSGACALSAIEQAMWDIAGQIYNVPVYTLFGGKLHDRIRNYANINRSTFDRTPAGFAKWAADAVKNGYDAIKLAPFDGFPRDAAQVEPHIRNGIDCVKAIRDAAGPNRDILIDAHSNFTLERGLKLAEELEPMKLFWLEEVCRGIPNLARINEAAKMPTAGGESIFGTHGFHPYIHGGAVDILMPDIKYCGGLLELKKIAAMGEAAGLPVSPHGPASPIGNIAAAHVCSTLPNFLILELGYGEVPWRADVVTPAEPMNKGYLTLNDKPGFGFQLNDSLLRKQATKVQ
ncbi:MAG: mandelate racemase/muconate lactonizing enzyme family protein [Bryobacteraceae bacterium]